MIRETAETERFSGLAEYSDDEVYRYTLWRNFDGLYKHNGAVNFIMLNPSTATAGKSDPTVTRCEGFARAWGYRDLIVTNLYALRSTDPRQLARHPDPVGPVNTKVILNAALDAMLVIAAWGVSEPRGRDPRGPKVLRMLHAAGVRVFGLSFTQNGTPRHPLYLRGDVLPVEIPHAVRA